MYDPKRGYPAAVPYLLYRDPAAAARWLIDVLGFREAIRFTVPDGGPIGHVELERDGAVLMLGMTGGRFGETSSITLVFVDDVDQACSRASLAGGVILDQSRDRPWGLRQAVVADPEGQRWELSQHLHDVAPADPRRSI
ncbi:MAG: VOC family protein [Actinomycetota bacterium]|nr:VOC family protein [Actinomycetota bacterium]